MRTNIILSVFVLFIFSCSESGDSAEMGGVGQGGSMTRFSIQGNTMYVVDNSSIQVFSIINDQFTKVNTVEANLGMETIFAKGDYLYLGARDAMYIYSIVTPDQPTFIFRYAHIVSCDPVVVQGNRAYVTMSSGSACNLGTNALEIIDISNPMDPTLITNYPMTSPQGLSVVGNLLFICEGSAGLKLLDITNELQIQVVNKLETFHAYDVITKGGIATITGDDGIFQYRYNAGGTDIELLSKIPVTRAEL